MHHPGVPVSSVWTGRGPSLHGTLEGGRRAGQGGGAPMDESSRGICGSSSSCCIQHPHTSTRSSHTRAQGQEGDV